MIEWIYGLPYIECSDGNKEKYILTFELGGYYFL